MKLFISYGFGSLALFYFNRKTCCDLVCDAWFILEDDDRTG